MPLRKVGCHCSGLYVFAEVCLLGVLSVRVCSSDLEHVLRSLEDPQGCSGLQPEHPCPFFFFHLITCSCLAGRCPRTLLVRVKFHSGINPRPGLQHGLHVAKCFFG